MPFYGDPNTGEPTLKVLATSDTTGATDTGNIQAAINALRNKGGLVSLQGSQFYINSTLLLYPGIALSGQGPLGVSTPVAGATVLTGVAALNASIIQMQLDPSNTGWASFPVLQNLTLNGNTSNASQHGIQVSNTAGTILDWYILNVGVFNVGGNGLNVSNATTGKGWIDKCYFEHCQANGIRNATDALRVTQSYIYANTLYGIDGTSSAFMMLSQNLMGSNASGAVQTGSMGSGGQIIDNYFFDNGTHGVVSTDWAIHVTTMGGTNQFIIMGNNFKDSRGAGAGGTHAVTNFINTGDSGACQVSVLGNTFVGMQGDAWLRKFNNAGDLYMVQYNLGYNNVKGKITNPVNTTNNTLSTVGTTSTVVASTDYIIQDAPLWVKSSAGTGVSITVKDNGGNTIDSGLTAISDIIPVGYKINFGGFSVAPTLVVAVAM